MNAALERAPQQPNPQEQMSRSQDFQARLQTLMDKRASLQGRRGAPMSAEARQELVHDFRALKKEASAEIKNLKKSGLSAEDQAAELLALTQTRNEARRLEKSVGKKAKKGSVVAAESAPVPTATVFETMDGEEETEDDLSPEAQATLAEMARETKKEAEEAEASENPWVAPPLHTYLEPEKSKVDTGEAEETEPEIITKKEQVWLDGDDNAFKVKLADRAARRPKQRVTTSPAEQKESLQESLQSLHHQRTSLRAERDALEEISVGQRTKQQKARLASVRESLNTITTSIEQTTSELAKVSQRIENNLIEARAAERKAQEAAKLEEERALARSLAAEENRKLSVKSFVEQSRASANERLQQAAEQADAITGLRGEISKKESAIENIEDALSVVEEKLATAKSDRKLLEGQEGSALNTMNLRALDEDISRYEQDIAHKEEAIQQLDNQIIEIRLEIKKLLSAEEQAENEARFTPNPDADKREQVTNLQRKRAELAKSRERLAAAQAEAKVIAARVRADAELAAAQEMQAAKIARRIQGSEAPVNAVKAKIEDQAAGYTQPARLEEQMTELTKKEAAILTQIENLEAGIGPDASPELSGIQKYLELDNTGLNTLYTFMKIMEEDDKVVSILPVDKVVSILPVDIASQVAGRTWTELVKELQTASQKTGLMSRMWRSVFGDPNAKLKEALQAISELNPAELRRAASIPLDRKAARHQNHYSSRMRERASSLGNTNVAPFGGVTHRL